MKLTEFVESQKIARSRDAMKVFFPWIVHNLVYGDWRKCCAEYQLSNGLN